MRRSESSPRPSMVTWHIRKTDGDEYRVRGGGQFTRIEENVDGPSLLGMLTGKFSDEQVMDIVFSLDAKEIGFQTSISFMPSAS